MIILSSCFLTFSSGFQHTSRGPRMSFHTIIRIQGHPARADQSALCAINRHLLVARFICQSTSSAVSARDFSSYVFPAALLILTTHRPVPSLTLLPSDAVGAR